MTWKFWSARHGPGEGGEVMRLDTAGMVVSFFGIALTCFGIWMILLARGGR